MDSTIYWTPHEDSNDGCAAGDGGDGGVANRSAVAECAVEGITADGRRQGRYERARAADAG